MSTTAVLPSNLRDKLAAVCRRIRWLRAVRGLSLAVLVMVATGGCALLADAAFELPNFIRRILLCGWLGTGAVAALFGLVIPLCRRLDPAALAAVVEEKYPELGERLTTTVELADAHDSYHGAPALVDLLVRETEEQSGSLDFQRAFPVRRAGRLAALAAIAIVLALSPALFWRDQYEELAGRFAFAWGTPSLFVPYTIEVTPGDAFAAVGRPLTLSACLHARRANIALPQACTLLRTDADGNTSQQRMTADRPDAFSLKLEKLTGDFRYRIQAGEAVSQEFQVTAVDPVELADGSPAIAVTPPTYAKATVEPQTLHGMADLSAVQFSKIEFSFGFTRPAVSAALEWQAKDGEQQAQVIPLELAADRREGRLELPAAADGSYKVILEAEHDIRTELPPRSLKVKIDQPPVFVKVSGSDHDQFLHPYDKVPLELSLADDVGVDVAEIEYRINQGPSAFEPIALEGRGQRQAKAKHQFQLADKTHEGDLVQYRIKAADNRRVPEANLGPQVIYHPPESSPGKPRWRTLRITRKADPMNKPEISAQRDDINRRLDAIQEKLKAEQNKLSKLQADVRNQIAMTAEQVKEVGELRKDNRGVVDDLHELARTAAENPGLEPIRDRATEVARQEMRRSDEGLTQAAKEMQQPARADNLQKSHKELEAAKRKLEELRKQNDQLAQARLDQMNLETLASRQQQLAERSGEQATKDPVKDPESSKKSTDLKRDQAELAKDLQQQTDQSEPLKKALDAARTDQARNLAEKAKELAEAQRDLAKAAKDTNQQQNQDRFAELAKKQKELAERADRLAKETKQPAQVAKAQPLKPEEAKKAADALEKGDAAEAMQHQDQAARDLEKLARDLDKSLDLAKDPREAAGQLARLQEELRKQLKEEKTPNSERRQDMQRQEQAIQRAAADLSVPEQDRLAKKGRQDAAEKAAQAAEALPNKNPKPAENLMNEARQALERLAKRLPSLEDGQRQAQAEVARLKQQQEAIARQAEQALKDVDKEGAKSPKAKEKLSQRLAEAAKKQSETADKLGQTDAPNQEARRDRAQEAMDRAMEDLQAGQLKNIAASQQEAKKQLERLEQALAGKNPVEEAVVAKPQAAKEAAEKVAREMARQQRRLAEATQKAEQLAGKPDMQKALEPIAQQQQALNRQAQRMPDQQAQPRQAQKEMQTAREAMERAQQALAQQNPTKARQDQSAAANALERAAERMAKEAPPSQPQTQTAAKPKDSSPPEGLPTRQQADQAKQLAQQQKALREAVQRLVQVPQPVKAPGKEDPAGELAKQQQQVAKQAAELAKNVGQEQGQQSPPAQQAQQAAQSSQQASKQMQAGAPQRAQTAGKQAAQELRQLAQQLGQSQKGQAPQQAKQAGQLAERQENLNRQMEPLAQDTAGQQGQQQTRQEELKNQTGELSQQLQNLARQMNRSLQSQSSANQATAAARQAQAAMQQAQEQGRQGNQGQSQQSQQQAAKALDQAARQASQAAQQSPQQGNPQTGQALAKAQEQMNQAQGQLNQGQNHNAQNSMQQAAQALQQAAQNLAKALSPQPNRPDLSPLLTHLGASPDGRIDEKLLPDNAKKYAGKTWGELPGELRTKIIQDLTAPYGEDYGRVIKMYFEQIADTASKNKR